MELKEVNYVIDKFGRCIMDESIKEISGVYLLFSKDLELLYIGQSNKLRSRIKDHVNPNNPRRNENPKEGDWNYLSKLKVGSVKFYSFIEAESRTEKDMIENTLIYLLRPKLNAFCAKEETKSKRRKD